MVTDFHWMMVALGGLSISFSSLNLGLLSFILAQLVKDWSLSPLEAGTLVTVSALGGMVGSPVGGYLSDRFGRRKALPLALLLCSLGTMLCAIAPTYLWLAAFVVLSGAGIQAAYPAASALIGEFAPASHRGRLVAYLETFWVGGVLVASILTYVIVPQFGWRAGFLLGALPALYAVVVYRLAPESPRHLISSGDYRKAQQIMGWLERKHGVLLQQPPSGTRSLPESRSWKELFSPMYRRRTLVLWVLWTAQVFTYRGVFTWLPTLLLSSSGQIEVAYRLALFLTLVQIPGTLTAAMLVDRVGRKRTLAAAQCISGLAMVPFGLTQGQDWLLLWGAVMAAGNLGAYSVLLTYTPELYPTRIRSTGSGSASGVGRIGGMVAPQMVALLLGSWGSSQVLVFSMFGAVMLCSATVCALLGEETAGKTLESISK